MYYSIGIYNDKIIFSFTTFYADIPNQSVLLISVSVTVSGTAIFAVILFFCIIFFTIKSFGKIRHRKEKCKNSGPIKHQKLNNSTSDQIARDSEEE